MMNRDAMRLMKKNVIVPVEKTLYSLILRLVYRWHGRDIEYLQKSKVRLVTKI